jgi:hypothetical protein
MLIVMEQRVFIILLLIVLIVIFKLFFSSYFSEDFAGAITQLVSTGPDDIHLNIGIEKYIPPYGYYGYGCLSPYCRRRSWWYNRYTPLPWNNPTRFPRWIYPPYDYLTDYYRNYYTYY